MIKKNRLWEIFSATLTPSILIEGTTYPFKIIAANRSFESMSGTDEDSLVGMGVKNVFSAFAPKDNKNFVGELEDSIALVMHTKRPYDMMVHRVYLPIIKSTSLREKKWRIIITPFFEDHDQIDCILLSVTDVTEQIQMKDKDKAIYYSLTYHQHIYKSIFENHPNQIFQMDPTGKLIAANSKFLDFFGMDGKLLDNISISKFATRESEQIVMGFVKKCANRTTQDFNTSVIAKNNMKVYCGITFIPLIVENKLVGIFGILTDKSQEKSSEQKAILKGFYSTTIAEVNKILIEEPEEDRTLSQIFNLTGQALNVDRIFLYERQSALADNSMHFKQRIHWSHNKLLINQPEPSLDMLPGEELQHVIKTLEKQKIYKAKISNLPKGRFRDLLIEQKVFSLIMVPIFWHKKLAGFIIFQDCEEERNWTYEDVSFLKSIVENLSIALEQRRSTQNLMEIQRKYETIIKNIPGIVYHGLPDEKRTMFFINEGISEVTGYEANTFITKELNFPDIIHPDDTNTVLNSLYAALSDKHANDWIGQYRVIRSDGSIEKVVDRVSILRNEDGVPLRLIGVIIKTGEQTGGQISHKV